MPPGKAKKPSTGLIFLAVYGLSLVVGYLASTPTETEDFTDRTAREFSIAAVSTDDSGEVTYRSLNLEILNSENLDTTNLSFLLDQPSVTINVGDIHRAEVLEDYGDRQLVAFHYSNTRTSTSVYHAYRDRVEPVSYRITSSVGHMSMAIFLLVPALVATWAISAIVMWRRKRRIAQA